MSEKILCDDVYMIHMLALAKQVAESATCNRLSVGALILSENGSILGSGSNRSLKGQPSCRDVGCLMFQGNCKRTVHAEMAAMFHAVKRGYNLTGKTIVCTHYPCPDCMKYIAASGITTVYYENPYTHKYENEFAKDIKLIPYSEIFSALSQK